MESTTPQTISYPAPGSRTSRGLLDTLAPHVVVLFGATGDLAKRKLLPGLAYLWSSHLAPDVRVVGTAIDDITTEEFRELAAAAVGEFGHHPMDHEQLGGYLQQLVYIPQSAGPDGLTAAVKDAEDTLGPRARRLHYLSVPPRAARAVITTLREADLVDRSRVVMEKPFGDDLASAIELNPEPPTDIR